jgi:holliday junction DNA helicase RuvA
MIGKIKGTLSEVNGNTGLIETASGLSYEVYLTSTILSSKFPGDQIEIYTHHHIREDTQVLFGFNEKNEHQMFKLLLSVDGVGPKTAFTVISFSTVDNLVKAVTSNDIEYFSKIPGLGKKTSMKIMLEMSSKLNSEFRMEKMHLSEDEKTIVDALVALGFRSAEAKNILSEIPPELSLENKIKEAIRLATNPKKNKV